MNTITLTINPEDTNYEPETRSFTDRLTALGKIDELYANRHIGRKEWNRLVNILYPEEEKVPIVSGNQKLVEAAV